MSYIFKEKTSDHGLPISYGASNNFATYILTSSWAKDMRKHYIDKYNRLPSAQWYNRHFVFERIK